MNADVILFSQQFTKRNVKKNVLFLGSVLQIKNMYDGILDILINNYVFSDENLVNY